jgi:hypothetical protein
LLPAIVFFRSKVGEKWRERPHLVGMASFSTEHFRNPSASPDPAVTVFR